MVVSTVLVFLREVWPTDLDELWCDCEKFQKLHLPFSHVFAACKHACHDFIMYISLMDTLKQVSHVYKGLFGELRNKDYW